MRRILLILCPLALSVAFMNHSQPSGGSPGIQAAISANSPRLVRGPYLQVATDTSMVIRWRTDVLTRSRIRYGTALRHLDSTVDDLSLQTEHEIKITGLSANTKYYYAVGTLKDTLQYGPDHYFNTLPVPGAEGHYRIGIFGDCGDLSEDQAAVRDRFVSFLGGHDLTAWILLGDNAYNDGTDLEYQEKFFAPYQDQLLKKYPFFPAPGNHDYHDIDFGKTYAQQHHTMAYYKNFSMPTNGEAGGVPSRNPAFYSFDIGNIHFISLDSYGQEENRYFLYDTLGPQVQWLKKDLEANRNRGWVIAYWHHPPYSKGTHDSDTDELMSMIRENLLRVLAGYEIDLVICGHSHVYERSALMKDHYGRSGTFSKARHNIANAASSYGGTKNDALYVKEPGKNKGTVYVVSGSSSHAGRSTSDFPHAAMQYSNDSIAGAALLEVRQNRLDLIWVCADGVVRDRFTMMKTINKKSAVLPAK